MILAACGGELIKCSMAQVALKQRLEELATGHYWAIDLILYQFLFKIVAFCLCWPTRDDSLEM